MGLSGFNRARQRRKLKRNESAKITENQDAHEEAKKKSSKKKKGVEDAADRF